VAEKSSHSLNLEDRKLLSLTGVKNVGSYDEKEIHLETTAGPLSLKGEGLNISHLDLENGKMVVAGSISSLLYDVSGSRGKNLWQRITK